MELESTIDKAVEAVGLQSLKPLQCHVINPFVTGNDVFVSLPTGFGKSYALYCYLLSLTIYSILEALLFFVYLPLYL